MALSFNLNCDCHGCPVIEMGERLLSNSVCDKLFRPVVVYLESTASDPVRSFVDFALEWHLDLAFENYIVLIQSHFSEIVMSNIHVSKQTVCYT